MRGAVGKGWRQGQGKAVAVCFAGLEPALVRPGDGQDLVVHLCEDLQAFSGIIRMKRPAGQAQPTVRDHPAQSGCQGCGRFGEIQGRGDCFAGIGHPDVKDRGFGQHHRRDWDPEPVTSVSKGFGSRVKMLGPPYPEADAFGSQFHPEAPVRIGRVKCPP